MLLLHELQFAVPGDHFNAVSWMEQEEGRTLGEGLTPAKLLLTQRGGGNQEAAVTKLLEQDELLGKGERG